MEGHYNGAANVVSSLFKSPSRWIARFTYRRKRNCPCKLVLEVVDQSSKISMIDATALLNRELAFDRSSG